MLYQATQINIWCFYGGGGLHFAKNPPPRVGFWCEGGGDFLRISICTYAVRRRMRDFSKSRFPHMISAVWYALFSRISFSTYALLIIICVIFANLIFYICTAKKHMRFFRESHFLHMHCQKTYALFS